MEGRSEEHVSDHRYDKTKTQHRWPSILAALGVDSKTLSKNNVSCPFCGGKDRFRFTDHEGAGVWICNQCGTGNGIQFVMRHLDCDFRYAVSEVMKVLPTALESKIAPERDPRPKLNRLWSGAAPLVQGDAVSLYLKARGFPLPLTGELRCHPAAPYYKDGSVIAFHPAMVARVRDREGNPKTLHVTYLTEDGRKAEVETQRKVLSKTGDGPAIHLFEPDDGVLHVGEGIETCLGVKRRIESYGQLGGVWALMSAGSMLNFQPPAYVTALVIWADNDASYTGQHAAFTLAHRLHQKIEVEVLVPRGKGSDWGDLQSPKG